MLGLWQKRLGWVLVLLLSFAAQASDMGSPGLWFTVFLVASFLHCGTLYLLGALVFITCAKEGKANRKFAFWVPNSLIALSFLGFITTGFAMFITIAGALLGWGAAYALHYWAGKKWRSIRQGT